MNDASKNYQALKVILPRNVNKHSKTDVHTLKQDESIMKVQIYGCIDFHNILHDSGNFFVQTEGVEIRVHGLYATNKPSCSMSLNCIKL